MFWGAKENHQRKGGKSKESSLLSLRSGRGGTKYCRKRDPGLQDKGVPYVCNGNGREKERKGNNSAASFERAKLLRMDWDTSKKDRDTPSLGAWRWLQEEEKRCREENAAVGKDPRTRKELWKSRQKELCEKETPPKTETSWSSKVPDGTTKEEEYKMPKEYDGGHDPRKKGANSLTSLRRKRKSKRKACQAKNLGWWGGWGVWFGGGGGGGGGQNASKSKKRRQPLYYHPHRGRGKRYDESSEEKRERWDKGKKEVRQKRGRKKKMKTLRGPQASETLEGCPRSGQSSLSCCPHTKCN